MVVLVSSSGCALMCLTVHTADQTEGMECWCWQETNLLLKLMWMWQSQRRNPGLMTEMHDRMV